MNPAAMVKNPPVQSSPERLLYQRPEWPDLLEFSRTDENPYDEPDLDLWLHDSLDAEPQWVVLLCAITCRATLLPAMEILKTGYSHRATRKPSPRI